jgi:hypothetical protein
MHILDINIDDTNLNPRTFRVTDNSTWDKFMDVKNALLQIIPPGFNAYVTFKVKKNFQETINANLLGLNTLGLPNVPSIPDGLYRIKFSVDPNEETALEYNYFRTVKQKNIYMDLLTQLLHKRNEFSNTEFKKKKEELIWIWIQILGIKHMAEDRDEVGKAYAMYEDVHRQLKDFRVWK